MINNYLFALKTKKAQFLFERDSIISSTPIVKKHWILFSLLLVDLA